MATTARDVRISLRDGFRAGHQLRGRRGLHVRESAELDWLWQRTWRETNYNSRLEPYQELDVINNDITKLLRSECLY